MKDNPALLASIGAGIESARKRKRINPPPKLPRDWGRLPGKGNTDKAKERT